MSRRLVHVTLAALSASAVFVLGAYGAQRLAAVQLAEREATIETLRDEVARSLLVLRQGERLLAAGTAGRLGVVDTTVPKDVGSRAALVEEIKQQLQHEMGLVPIRLLRDRQQSFVELYAYDSRGRSSYGTAGYLGGGYFITVKHGVVALGADADARRIVSIKLMHGRKALRATLVDAGDAQAEVDAGDWAILKVREAVDLPPLRVNLAYGYSFADPIFRLGNDYSKGIILSTGYVGQRTSNGLVTCLTDGHPGVSGGGVLNQQGDLVGIPIGRMQGDYRFSFILPVRREMFRRVTDVSFSPDATRSAGE